MFRRLAGLVSGILTTGVVVLGALTWWVQNSIKQPLAVPAEGVQMTVPRGRGVSWLADELATRGWVESALPLKIYARVKGREAIQAGRYDALPTDTPAGLLAKINAGDVVKFSIAFPEGWTVRQWRAALADAAEITPVETAAEDTALAAYLGIAQDIPEGWFAPDTYYYVAGDSDLSIFKRAYQGMLGLIGGAWPSRAEDLPYTTPYQALIMASIVEKETGLASERAAIAGVFVRRLRKGMLLQTDPTVIYGLGAAFDGNLKREHLRADNPYNTYRRAGLPPTPIANAGADALKAALHPEPGSALYFVARGDGSHQFSDNLEAHVRAVRQYQIEQRKAGYRSAPQVK